MTDYPSANDAAQAPVPPVVTVAESPSTNTELVAALRGEGELAAHDWPHLSALVTDHQTAGRGRGERGWETPAGQALTVSIVLRPQGVPQRAWGWLPLIVGLAVVRAVQPLLPVGLTAAIKWPNDVVVTGDQTEPVAGWGSARKICGILCEALPAEGAVVAGIGVNVSQPAGTLPVPHAASLLSLGATNVTRIDVLGAVLDHLDTLVRAWEGDDGVVPISRQVADACVTIGQAVAVDVPGRSPVTGTARSLDQDGALVVETASGEIHTVRAGDVRVRAG